MTSWLTSNELMATELLSHGIPDHLGSERLSAVAQMAVSTHRFADQIHSLKQTQTDDYINTINALPSAKRPINRLLGQTIDQAAQQWTRHNYWPSTQAKFQSQQICLELAVAIKDELARTQTTPDLPEPLGIENEDYLWLVMTQGSALLAAVPMEYSVAWADECFQTLRLRFYPIEYLGLNPAREKHPPACISIDGIYMIPLQHQQWARLNLCPGSASLGSLVLPVPVPVHAQT